MMRAVILANFDRTNAKKAYIDLKEKYEVLPTFGNYDLMIAVEAENYVEISKIILSINRTEGIANTDSMMVVPNEVLLETLSE